MAEVLLYRDIAKQFTGGREKIHVDAKDVRSLLRALNSDFPGLAEVLQTDMAVAIDGQIYHDALLEPIEENSEICFLPAIEGG
jgi:molybdopterin synthase sulfur carrier subunit